MFTTSLSAGLIDDCDDLIECSVGAGQQKQDYIISRVLNRDIVVQPNLRVYKALKDRLELVLAELKKSEEAATNSDLLETINLIAVTLNGIKGGE